MSGRPFTTHILTTPSRATAVRQALLASGVDAQLLVGEITLLAETLRKGDPSVVLIGVADEGVHRGCLDEIISYRALTPELLALAARTSVERVAMVSRLADAERSSRHKEQLASLGVVVAGAMHEINNPTAALRLSMEALGDLVGELRTEVARLEELLVAPGAHELEAARASVGQLHALLREDGATSLIGDSLEDLHVIRDVARDLRTIASVESKDVAPEIVNVATVVKQALRLSPIDPDVVHVELDFSDPVPLLWLPRSRLVQIVSNLVTNACHAMQQIERPMHRLRISVREDETTLLLAVSDTGIGIEPEVLPSVFEPFFTTKGPERGTGLGLSMSREIVRRLGGDLCIDAIAGEGAIAMVFLPLSLRADVTPPPSDRQRPRVLLVDSDFERLRRMERALRHDFEVLVAQSGLDALALLESGARVDGILGEATMREMDGEAFLGEVKAHWPSRQRHVVLYGSETPVEGVRVAHCPSDDAAWLALAREATGMALH